MTTVALSDIVAATDKGPDLISKWAANNAALRLDSAAKDSATAAALQSISDLKALVASLRTAIYTPPVGAYVAPGLNGPQLYSGNANLWSGATVVSRLLVDSNQLYNTATMTYADAWTSTADYLLCNEEPSNSAYNHALVFKRISRTASGVCTVNSSIQIGSDTNANAFYPISVTVLSATQVIVRYLYNSSVYSVTVTWDGNATLSSTSLTRTYLTNVTPSTASNLRRGCLIGNGSLVDYGAYGNLTTAGLLSDRAMAVAGGIIGNLQYPPSAGGQISHDYLGGGYVVRFGASATPTDATSRPTVWLELWDDNGCTVLQKLRVPGRTIASVVSCVVLSPTLAIVQWLDTSSNRYTACVGINTGTGVLSLYGPYTTGNMGAQSFGYPILFDALDAYFFRLVTASTGACKLMLAQFNPNGAQGSELTSTTANDLNLAIGSSANSGAGVAALTGLSSVSLLGVWVGAANMLCILYYAATSGTGASTAGLYLDTFTLS